MAAHCGSLIFLAILAQEDMKKKEISVRKVFLFALCAILYRIGVGQLIWGEVVRCLIPGGMLILLSYLTRESIGYGDGTAVMALGLWMGGRFAVLSVCAGIMLSGIYGVSCLIRHRKEPIPFIPFLLLGMEAVLAYA